VTQEEALKIVICTLEKNNILYMLTGAIAVNYYGRPRLTHDVDIIVNIEKNIFRTSLMLSIKNFMFLQKVLRMLLKMAPPLI